MIENKFNQVKPANGAELSRRGLAETDSAALALFHATPTKRNNRKMKTPLCSYTCLAFLVNRVMDEAPDTALSFDEIFEAASDGRLIALLAWRYGHIADFTFATEPGFVDLEQMETALRDAATGFEGRVGRATGMVSGLCLVMDIVLEAIQRRVRRPAAGWLREQVTARRLHPAGNGCGRSRLCLRHGRGGIEMGADGR